MIKNRLNTVKHRLLVEKDRGNACRKNQEKNEPFFLANFFRGLSFYGADCTVIDKEGYTKPIFSKTKLTEGKTITRPAVVGKGMK